MSKSDRKYRRIEQAIAARKQNQMKTEGEGEMPEEAITIITNACGVRGKS
jgi:hypothetical protein